MNKVISRSPIFKGLTEEEVADILKETPHSIRSYRKGQTIAQRTEEVKNLSIIIEGSVKGEMVDFSGKILKIEEMFAPKPIAHAFLFGENNKFPVDVIALEDCKLLHIPKIEFLNLMQKNSKVLTNYLNTISNRAQFLSNKLWFLSFKTIKEKIAHYLLNLSKSETRTTIILPKSHQELAEFFGVTRPSLARVLSELQDGGIIHVNRREVTIIDKKKLLELIN
ncbi:Crp/Fnr family transcriptional regulator [Tenuifilum thalassicum]|uniref:Crp/Fnr family transcriptional regulator n=1 Tax=Tenuifilum thalassicum TaxID=2590900 RepID=A0A7D3XN00_9BACT|nr:Crp/Fnr family transcriptional regulator [Tenuifilum thalassicum]QKG80596.1 Crp/Fnr family transcriptional regulator [Tenuifilum thalassicum]